MPKIKIKDNQYNLSQEAVTAILAERTEYNREISSLKDADTQKEQEMSLLKDKVAASEAKAKKLKKQLLLNDVSSAIKEVDADYKIKDKNPYKVMAAFANVEESKHKDKSYVQACFDSVITAKLKAQDKKLLEDKKPNKKSDSIIPKKYLGGE